MWKLEPELVEALLDDDDLCIQEWDVSRTLPAPVLIGISLSILQT